MESLIKKLEKSRKELLDTGLRGNTLLNFKQGANALEVIDERSAEVFKILVGERKAMSLLPLPASEESEEDEASLSKPLPEILEEMYGDDRHTDTRLQTRLPVDSLDKKLLKINATARGYYLEQGIDILYLALGFLTWFESDSSDRLRKAPLVLVPVSLQRTSVRGRFKVDYTGADLGTNLILETKLKEFQLVLPKFEEDSDIRTYFDEVAGCVNDKSGWQVNEDEIALGFFQFGRFQMYQDLDPDRWPEGKKPKDHRILQQLLEDGFTDDDSNGDFLSNGEISSHQLSELHFVKDADSSQTEAVLKVKQGTNLMIKGPPGTGKSQTITNIISESLASDKTVLFVAEKMAALEVVKRRLDECQLGDAVLELHSHKSNKRTVLQELKRTLELEVLDVKDYSNEKKDYVQLCKKLDAYCYQVNQSILDSETNYIDAVGHLLKLNEECREHQLPKLESTKLRDWDKNAFSSACGTIKKLISCLEGMGTPDQNPFATSELEQFSPLDKEEIVDLLNKAQEQLSRCLELSNELSEELGLGTSENFADIGTVCDAARRVLDAPDLEGLNLTADDWRQCGDEIRALLSSGAEMAELQTRYRDQLIDRAWEAELLDARQVWLDIGYRWLRFFSRDFRQAKRTLQGLVKGKLPVSADECMALIDAVFKYQNQDKQYANYESLGENLFGVRWKGKRSDWEVLKTLSDWLIDWYQDGSKEDVVKGSLEFLESRVTLSVGGEDLEKIDKSTKDLKTLIEDIIHRLEIHLPEIEAQTFKVLEDRLNFWHDQIDSLYKMAHYNQLRKDLRDIDLKEIDKLAYSWKLSPNLLLILFQKTWYEGLITEAYQENIALQSFDRKSHESNINEFRHLDKKLFGCAQEALVSKHRQSLSTFDTPKDEVKHLRHEIGKKRRHIPIRQLIIKAGRAIQKIKPVFMMSPMSVATYLEQGELDFDLVVFDEASQIKVVDAFGSILRGKQVVVVGDMRQMPPTNFFGSEVKLDDEEAEESQTADIESILSMFESQGAPEAMLCWHYRSHDDSLIAVSNQEFYGNRLMIFPSPGGDTDATGLKFNYQPESTYDRGGSRTNVLEARAVAEAVMLHAKTYPDLTLGVVAFSVPQRDCILLEIERLRRSDESCEEFFSSKGSDDFFVKNLENVQGDERDVIFISIGYGRTPAGRMTKNFGPVNRNGGERRLNVLITRARKTMEVFSNFTADYLETNANSPFGVRSFKKFLHYAETRKLENDRESGRETDSPFEDNVIVAIQQLGYEVEPQLGSENFYIDIAVRDPDKPGRYILAVECDGASYHSSSAARDRDRLRQSVLENKGWRFHRIWSTDWFRYPDKETERLKKSIDQSRQFYKELDMSNNF